MHGVPCHVLPSVECSDAKPCRGNQLLSFLLVIYLSNQTADYLFTAVQSHLYSLYFYALQTFITARAVTWQDRNLIFKILLGRRTMDTLSSGGTCFALPKNVLYYYYWNCYGNHLLLQDFESALKFRWLVACWLVWLVRILWPILQDIVEYGINSCSACRLSIRVVINP